MENNFVLCVFVSSESFAVTVVLKDDLCDTGCSGLLFLRYHHDKQVNITFFGEQSPLGCHHFRKL